MQVCTAICMLLIYIYSFLGTWKNTIELVAQSDGSFRQLWKLTGHKGGITSMAFSLDGTRLYSGARKDKEIICWDLRVRAPPTITQGKLQ